LSPCAIAAAEISGEEIDHLRLSGGVVSLSGG
jgi:hypothetical protein